MSRRPSTWGTYAQRPFLGDDGRPSTGWHAEFGDVDNDGRDDLFIAKGNVDQMPSNAAKDPNNLLMQRRTGTVRRSGAGSRARHHRAEPRGRACRSEQRRPSRSRGGQPPRADGALAERDGRCRRSHRGGDTAKWSEHARRGGVDRGAHRRARPLARGDGGRRPWRRAGRAAALRTGQRRSAPMSASTGRMAQHPQWVRLPAGYRGTIERRRVNAREREAQARTASKKLAARPRFYRSTASPLGTSVRDLRLTRMRVGQGIEEGEDRCDLRVIELLTLPCIRGVDGFLLVSIRQRREIVECVGSGQDRRGNMFRAWIDVMAQVAFQRRESAGMSVWCGQRHVPERRCAKLVGIRRVAGHAHAPDIAMMGLEALRLSGSELRLAHGVKGVIAEKRTGMTGHAAGRAIEEIQSPGCAALQWLLSSQMRVESGAVAAPFGGDEGGDRVGDVGEGDRGTRFDVRIGFGECLGIGGQITYAVSDQIPGTTGAGYAAGADRDGDFVFAVMAGHLVGREDRKHRLSRQDPGETRHHLVLHRACAGRWVASGPSRSARRGRAS